MFKQCFAYAILLLLVLTLVPPIQAGTLDVPEEHNNWKVTWSLLRDGISEKEYLITIQNLQGGAPTRQGTFELLFDNLSFPTGDLETVRFFMWAGETENVTDYNWGNVVYENEIILYDNENIVTGYENVTRFEVTGTTTDENLVAQWIEYDAEYFQQWATAKKFTQGDFLIPKAGSAPIYDDAGVLITENGVGWAKVIFEVPVTMDETENFHNSGRFALVLDDDEFCPWFNGSWGYRKAITLTVHPENYPIRLEIDNQDDLENLLGNSDFTDLRFLENENAGELKWWIENYNTGDNAIIHVLRSGNDNTQGDNVIYMYFGNSGVSTTDNATEVFGYDAGIDYGTNLDETDPARDIITIDTTDSRIEFTDLGTDDVAFVATDDFNNTIGSEWVVDFTTEVTAINNYTHCIGAGTDASKVVGNNDQHSGFFMWVDTYLKAMSCDGGGYDFGTNGGTPSINTVYYGRNTKVTDSYVMTQLWLEPDRDISKQIVTYAHDSSGLTTNAPTTLFLLSSFNTAGDNAGANGWVDTVMFKKFVDENEIPTGTYGSLETAPAAPDAPSSITIGGYSTPAYDLDRPTNLTPEITWLYEDDDGDNMVALYIEIYTTSGSVTYYKSENTVYNAENGDTITFNYPEDNLLKGIPYNVDIRHADNTDRWSATETAYFSIYDNQPSQATDITVDNVACAGSQGPGPTRADDNFVVKWLYIDNDGGEKKAHNITVTENGGSTVWFKYVLSTADNNTHENQRIDENIVRGTNYVITIQSIDNEDNASPNEDIFIGINQLPVVEYLEIENENGPTRIISSENEPHFDWTQSDPDTDNGAVDPLDNWQVRVGTGTAPNTDNNMWDNYGADNTPSTYYYGSTLTGGVTYYVAVRVRDNNGEWSTWDNDTFRINRPPHCDNIVVDNLENYYEHDDYTPVFAWDYYDADGDTQNFHRIRVGTTVGGNEMWGIETTYSADNYITYAGSSLQKGVLYYWDHQVNDGTEVCSYMTAEFMIDNFLVSGILLPENNTTLNYGVGFAYSATQDLIDNGYTFSWDFGDGQDNSTLSSGEHVYANVGVYSITLAVDTGGVEQVYVHDVTVTGATPPAPGGGGGGGGGFAAPAGTLLGDTERMIDPANNILFTVPFNLLGFQVTVWMILVGAIIGAYASDQRKLAVSALGVLLFLIVFGANLV